MLLDKITNQQELKQTQDVLLANRNDGRVLLGIKKELLEYSEGGEHHVKFIFWLQLFLLSNLQRCETVDLIVVNLVLLMKVLHFNRKFDKWQVDFDNIRFGTCRIPKMEQRKLLAIENNSKGRLINESIEYNLSKCKYSLLVPLYNKNTIYFLLQLLFKNFSQVQKVVLKILEMLPLCLLSRADVTSIVQFTQHLAASSSRHNQQVAEFLLLHVIRRKYVLEGGWLICLSNTAGSNDQIQSIESIVHHSRRLAYMQLACQESRSCEPSPKAYCVGCVIVKPSSESLFEEGEVISKGFSREIPGNTHAEECALIKLGQRHGRDDDETDDSDVSYGHAAGTVMYTTMEPCSVRTSGNYPCVLRCLSAKVRQVVIGVLEPDKFVKCTGLQQLVEGEVAVEVLRDRLLNYECMLPNMFLFPDSSVELFYRDLADYQRHFVLLTLLSSGRAMPAAVADLYLLLQLSASDAAVAVKLRCVLQVTDGAAHELRPLPEEVRPLVDSAHAVLAYLKALRYYYVLLALQLSKVVTRRTKS